VEDVVRAALLVAVACLTGPNILGAQSAPSAPAIAGTWQAKVKEKTRDGEKTLVKEVVIRADSSASYEKETVRWRMPAKDRIWLALGGEWEKFKIDLKGDKLVLSEGDLTEPITLKRIGPPTPRPAGVAVPPDPDAASD
jgi:hypothetical protein